VALTRDRLCVGRTNVTDALNAPQGVEASVPGRSWGRLGPAPLMLRGSQAVLRKNKGKEEDRTDFVREAVERELKRRERQS
jgi:hypothetical protein